MNEIWKEIENYEGLYQVSDKGRVRSALSGKVLKCPINSRGYNTIGLTKGGIRKSFRVHRLVAMAFLGMDISRPDVNHISSIKSENGVQNLEWVNRKENRTHARNKGFTGVWNRKDGGISARICIKGENLYIGSFDTREQAHQAYLNVLRFMGEENKYARR